LRPESRRRLLGQAAALAGLGLLPGAGLSRPPVGRMAETPFALGVASGEPSPDGMVLWTRLAPRPWEMGGGMTPEPVAVGWEIAEDPRFQRIAAGGRLYARVESAHAVHVEVGGLKPGREYWYRFTAAGHRSPAGRTLTAPAPGDRPQRLRAAFASCQKFEAGYYTAHRHIAESAPDLVLFLGDYIYEKPISLEGVRHPPIVEARDLDSYRLRHAVYRSDPDLQASHAAAPWMAIWDDHEVENDYGGDQDRRDADPAAFLRRRAAAYQAYYEHMPLRRTSLPVGPQMQLYRRLTWGRLAQIQFLDARQYRPHRTCDAAAHGREIPAACAERFDPARSLLGAAQEAWLQEGFRTTRARWNVLAQPYLMSPLKTAEAEVSNDGWDGYVGSYRRVLQGWRDAKVSNPLALGGDIHSFVAGDLALTPGGRPIASEFVGGSISSLARKDALPAQGFRDNPGLKFGHREHRGYGELELSAAGCVVTFHAVGDAQRRRSPVQTLARFVVADGQPGLQRA